MQNVNNNKLIIQQEIIEVDAEHAERENYPFQQGLNQVEAIGATASTSGVFHNEITVSGPNGPVLIKF